MICLLHQIPLEIVPCEELDTVVFRCPICGYEEPHYNSQELMQNMVLFLSSDWLKEYQNNGNRNTKRNWRV